MITSSDIEEAFACLGLSPSKDLLAVKQAYRTKVKQFAPLLADNIKDTQQRDQAATEYRQFQTQVEIARAFCNSPHPVSFFHGPPEGEFSALYTAFTQSLIRRDYNAWGIAPFGNEGPDLGKIESVSSIVCKPFTILEVVDKVVSQDSVRHFSAFGSNTKCSWIMLEMVDDWANPKALVFFYHPKSSWDIETYLTSKGLSPRSKGWGRYWGLQGSEFSIQIWDGHCSLVYHVHEKHGHPWIFQGWPCFPRSKVTTKLVDQWIERIRRGY